MGIAHAKALRLEPAYLRSDSCCQLFGLAARWAGGGGGQGQSERDVAGSTDWALIVEGRVGHAEGLNFILQAMEGF